MKVRCTRARDERFKVGKIYPVDEKGHIIDELGGHGLENPTDSFESWYRSCKWSDYDFELVEEKKMLNCKIKCLRPDIGFTKEKIYSVVNGLFIDDDGDKRPVSRPFDDGLYGSWRDQFEIVEKPLFTKEDIQSGDKVWTGNGYGTVIDFSGKLVIRYDDHSGWDYAKDDRNEIHKVVRPLREYDLCIGQETSGNVIFDREKGIGCESPVKEISVEEATKLLTEKFGNAVRIRVGE